MGLAEDSLGVQDAAKVVDGKLEITRTPNTVVTLLSVEDIDSEIARMNTLLTKLATDTQDVTDERDKWVAYRAQLLAAK
jgi:hypothetical protein